MSSAFSAASTLHALHQIGIGDERAAKGDEIGVTLSERTFGTGPVKATRQDEQAFECLTQPEI